MQNTNSITVHLKIHHLKIYIICMHKLTYLLQTIWILYAIKHFQVHSIPVHISAMPRY